MVNSLCANPYSIASTLPIAHTGLVPFEAKLLCNAVVKPEVTEAGLNTKDHIVTTPK